jgi:hypothetical protein
MKYKDSKSVRYYVNGLAKELTAANWYKMDRMNCWSLKWLCARVRH